MKLDLTERTLRPKHAFTLSRETISARRSVFVTLEHDGLTGHGEGSPIRRHGQSPEATHAALEGMRDALIDADPLNYRQLIPSLRPLAADSSTAMAAIDAAIMDWVGKSRNLPLYRLHGADPAAMPPTSMSIAIDTPERVQERAREARHFRILKIKLGGEQDRAMVDAIRAVTDVTIRGDANEGYASRETALREIEWLASRNVELIEQPLPADRLDDLAWLKARSPIPLIADEGFEALEDIPTLADAYHGINIKLVKSGGSLAALDAIAAARTHGLSVMLGSTVESSLGIAAAAHLAPLTDHVDLDGNLLIANDPFPGFPIEHGRIVLSDRPGLGIDGPARD
ncbi:MAG: dipeptide epimerase [Alphaproteobacteria bacterium]